MPIPVTDEANMSSTKSASKKRDKVSTPSKDTRTSPRFAGDNATEDAMETDDNQVKLPPSLKKQGKYSTKATTKSPTSSPVKKKTKQRSASVSSSKSRGRPVEREKSVEAPRSSRSRSRAGSRSASQVSRASAASSTKKKKTPRKKAAKSDDGADKSSYAAKAATPKAPAKKLKPLKHQLFLQGVLDCRKQEGLRHFVYGKLAIMLNTFQKVSGAKNCRIINFANDKGTPLTSGAQMPSEHVVVEQYFCFSGQRKQWNGQTIPEGKTRKISFSFCLNADIDIETIVDATTVDLIDHQLAIEVKTCQAISHESRLHFVRIHNKFNPETFGREISDQLTKLQKSEYKRDKDSFLGSLEAAGKKFPKTFVKKSYPSNGPWEKSKAGEDTRYKQMFVLEYPTSDAEHVEYAAHLFKQSGQLKQFWGQHASLHIAPSKDENETSKSTLDDWHSICNSHNSTVLSMGVIKFDDIRNPDVVVDVQYWKASKKSRPTQMSLRDVLHSIKVPGTDKDVQALHGMCPAPDGGWEVAFADVIPMAKSLAKNIASHPAGWILGYLKQKGWKSECIQKLLKKSFSTSSIVAAQNSTWDKKTGRVSSESVSATELELRDLEESWVDLNLGVKKGAVQDATLNSGDMAAFNFEDGASVQTLNRKDESDAESSYVSSSDDEESASGSEEEEDEEDAPDDGSISTKSHSMSVEKEDDDEDGFASAEEEDADGKSEEKEDDAEDEEEYKDTFSESFDKETDLEFPIRKLFAEDRGMQEILVSQAKDGLMSHQILDCYDTWALWGRSYKRLEQDVASLGKPNEEDPAYTAAVRELEEKRAMIEDNMEEAAYNLRAALEGYYFDYLAYADQLKADLANAQENEKNLESVRTNNPVAPPAAAEGEPDATKAMEVGEDNDSQEQSGRASG